MRDDIHKKVPRPKEVRSWVEAACRDADRVTGKTVDRLAVAVHRAARELSDAFVAVLNDRLAGTNNDLFGVVGIQSPRELRGNGSELERNVLAECQRRVAAGDLANGVLREAISDVLRDRSLADIRAAEPVLLPAGGRHVIEHMRGDVAALNYTAIAEKLMTGEQRHRAMRETLSPDENLLGLQATKEE